MQLLQSTSDIRPAEEVSDPSRLRPTNGFLVIRLCKQNEEKNPRLGALSSEKKRWKGWVGARGPNDVARIIWSLSRGSPGENCMGLFGRNDSDCILRTAAEGCGDYPETKGGRDHPQNRANYFDLVGLVFMELYGNAFKSQLVGRKVMKETLRERVLRLWIGRIYVEHNLSQVSFYQKDGRIDPNFNWPSLQQERSLINSLIICFKSPPLFPLPSNPVKLARSNVYLWVFCRIIVRGQTLYYLVYELRLREKKRLQLYGVHQPWQIALTSRGHVLSRPPPSSSLL